MNKEEILELIESVVDHILYCLDIDEDILHLQKNSWLQIPLIPEGYRHSFVNIISERTGCDISWHTDRILFIDFMYEDQMEV